MSQETQTPQTAPKTAEVKQDAVVPNHAVGQQVPTNPPEHGAPVVKRLPSSSNTPVLVAVIAVAILLGGISGWFGANMQDILASSAQPQPEETEPKVNENKEVREETKEEPLKGVVEEGGIDGEGDYSLEGQEVAMQSSLLDLSSFVGKNVQVWGEEDASSAVRLIDVTKVKEIN